MKTFGRPWPLLLLCSTIEWFLCPALDEAVARPGSTSPVLNFLILLSSGAASLSHLFAKVGSLYFDRSADLIQSRSHSLTDSIRKGYFLCHNEFSIGQLGLFFIRLVQEIGRNDCTFCMREVLRRLNVSRIEDISDSVPYPIGWLDTTEIVDYKNFGRKDRLKDPKLTQLSLCTVR